MFSGLYQKLMCRQKCGLHQGKDPYLRVCVLTFSYGQAHADFSQINQKWTWYENQQLTNSQARHAYFDENLICPVWPWPPNKYYYLKSNI